MHVASRILSMLFVTVVVLVTMLVFLSDAASPPVRTSMQAAAASSCKAILHAVFNSPGTNFEPGKTYEGSVHLENKGGAMTSDQTLYLTLSNATKPPWQLCLNRTCSSPLLQQNVSYKLRAGQMKDVPFWLKVASDATCNAKGELVAKIFDKDLKENQGYHTIVNQKILVSCASGGPGCGNARVDGEQCDDGNRKNGDGCNSACRIEPGWKCTLRTRSICTRS